MPLIADQMVKRRLAEVHASGGGMVVTSCATCTFMLKRNAPRSVDVANLATAIAQLSETVHGAGAVGRRRRLPSVLLRRDVIRLFAKSPMTTLSQLRAATVPRPDAMTRDLAKTIEPVSGFIVYGLLWLLVAAFTFGVSLLPSAAAEDHVPFAAYVALSIVLGLVGQVLIWRVYLGWMRRKRAAAAALVSDGQLVEGVVGNSMLSGLAALGNLAANNRTGHWAAVTVPDGRSLVCPFDRAPEPGSTAWVLCKLGYKYALAFDGESPIVAGIR